MLDIQGMEPDTSMLKGLALQEESSKAVKLFSVKHLPKEAAARFKALFQERAQWGWQDLQPYVDDLQASQPDNCITLSAHRSQCIGSSCFNTLLTVHTKRTQWGWHDLQPYVEDLQARHVKRAVA